MKNESNKKFIVNFALGARTVTGSNFCISNDKHKFLVDCGLLQGAATASEINREDFPYSPSDIEALFITHSHMDHVGRIPKLVKDGFNGIIYSTHASRDIAKLMLDDAVNLLAHEAVREGKMPLYIKEDVAKTMSLWQSVDYHEPLFFDKGTDDQIAVIFRDSGHVLGSSMIEFSYGQKKVVFTGDLGNSPSPLLRDTEKLTDTDYLLIESVYGDRNHEDLETRDIKLREIIINSIRRGGALVIPAFSLERTQDLLFKLNEMVEHNTIPKVAIYMDSPLAIALTEVFKKYEHLFNHDTQAIIKKGDDIFNFPGLKVTKETEESKAILHSPNPKIIIAGSGMINGGRIVHHVKNYLPDPKSTILLVGYQAVGTPGRLIDDGATEVNLFGEKVEVKAHIEKISGYSAHKDSDHLAAMIEPLVGKVKEVFVILGEPKASFFLAQKISDNYGVNVSVPERGDTVELDMS
jgi:metallo-beta-lactamase family protein